MSAAPPDADPERSEGALGFDPADVPSPSYVIDLALLERNLKRIDAVRRATGARVLLALKGFANFSTFPLCRRYLDGVTASSIDEARLGREEFGGEVHGYAPAYVDDEMISWIDLVDSLIFNSFSQWARFRPLVERVRADGRALEAGLRVNPLHSEQPHAMYDPCAPDSRLGVPPDSFRPDELDGLDGLHLHTCCGQGAAVLSRTIEAFESHFGRWLDRFRWVNLGGGQRISSDDYDTSLLLACIRGLKDRYGLDVVLEPGEAVARDAGWLVASVLDILREDRAQSEGAMAILDTSASAHLPDVLEMPYRPDVIGSGPPGEHPHRYRLGGLTCLAGDVIGEYSFPRPLEVGSRLVFTDMAHYTMVKNNTFNGLRLPSIVLIDSRTGELRVVREFGYEDYRGRLS